MKNYLHLTTLLVIASHLIISSQAGKEVIYHKLLKANDDDMYQMYSVALNDSKANATLLPIISIKQTAFNKYKSSSLFEYYPKKVSQRSSWIYTISQQFSSSTAYLIDENSYLTGLINNSKSDTVYQMTNTTRRKNDPLKSSNAMGILGLSGYNKGLIADDFSIILQEDNEKIMVNWNEDEVKSNEPLLEIESYIDWGVSSNGIKIQDDQTSQATFITYLDIQTPYIWSNIDTNRMIMDGIKDHTSLNIVEYKFYYQIEAEDDDSELDIYSKLPNVLIGDLKLDPSVYIKVQKPKGDSENSKTKYYIMFAAYDDSMNYKNSIYPEEWNFLDGDIIIGNGFFKRYVTRFQDDGVQSKISLYEPLNSKDGGNYSMLYIIIGVVIVVIGAGAFMGLKFKKSSKAMNVKDENSNRLELNQKL